MHAAAIHPLEALLRQRIVLLDGAMGTMVQRYKLSEEQYRGARFAAHPAKHLKGNLELLQLTQPEVIEEIHAQYLEAGADIIETNTFSATTIGQHDFLFPGEPENGRKDAAFFKHPALNLRAVLASTTSKTADLAAVKILLQGI